jgi:thiol-disulfide isomerase/thioredoxin
MKKQHLLLLFILLFSLNSFAKDGYNFNITIKGAPETKFFLGYYFGDKQYLRDSAVTDKSGKMTFKGDKALEGGVYLIASSEKALMFDFIVSEMFFSLETDLNDLIGLMKVKNSFENDVFFDYTKFTNVIGKEAGGIEENLKKAREANDTAQTRILTERYRKISIDLQDYRKGVLEKHPQSLLAKIFKMMTEIQVPDAPRNAKGEIIDSNFQYNYYYQHYFDNIDLADDRIVRTPVFHNKFESFIIKLTPQIPDSIIKSADIVLSKATGKENFKYMLFWITNHYETSTYMGMDKVFVHMVDKYYATGKAFWVDETLLFKMKDRADQLRNNLIGLRGQNLTMLDTSHVYQSLYNVKAKYSLLIFWDANCGKCKEEMPKLKKLYEELNPKASPNGSKFFDVFAVSLTPDAKEWQKYLREQNFKWLNIYDPNNETNFRKLYDIYSTPVLYLLDENKRIIAKRLNVDQVKEFIQEQESKRK